MKIFRYVRVILTIFTLVAAMAPFVLAQDGQNRSNQDRNGANLIRKWIRSQSTALQQLHAFSVSETVHNSLDAGGGQRNYRLVARRTATRTRDSENANNGTGPERFQMEREILQLVANGQEISEDRASRFLMQQRRMMRPEFSRIFESFRFPVQEVGRWESAHPLQLIEREGTHYWKLDGIAAIRPPFGPPPERGNGRQAGNRPSDDGQEDNRAPDNRQADNRLPANRQAGDRTESPPGRKSHVTAWFTTDTFRLHTTLIEYPLPGRFTLSLRTFYFRDGPLDIPKKRVIEGTIPVRRRSRMFAVRFKQTTDYTDYEFRRN